MKKEGFKPPRKPRPGKPASEHRARWERQLARLREVNANHGYGFWADDAEYAGKVIERLRQGYTIEIDEDEDVVLVPPKTKTKGDDDGDGC